MVNYCYCDLTAFIYDIITLMIDIEISYVKNRDNFLPHIEITVWSKHTVLELLAVLECGAT